MHEGHTTMVIALTVTKNTITPFISRFSRQLPNMVGDAGFEICKRAERNLKRSAERYNLKWTGRLIKSIEARRISKFRSEVFVAKYGIQLAEMSPHYVSLKRGRQIVKWTKDKFGNKRVSGRSRVGFTKRGKVSGALYVTPKRWIRRPLADAVRGADRIMNRHLRKLAI